MTPALPAVRFVVFAVLLLAGLATSAGLVHAIDGVVVPGAPPADDRPSSRPLGQTEKMPDEEQPAGDGFVKAPPSKAIAVLEAIQKRHGNPLPGYVGGRFFYNRERKLPPGRYREYDIHPKIPGRNRGAERLVIEQTTGKAYYTHDHYRTFTPMN